MKKTLALLLCAVMLLTLFAACGGGTNSPAADSTNAGGNAGTTAGGNAGSGGEKTKLTAIFSKHPLTKSLSEMEWLTQIQENAGVEITWEEVSSDWDQKRPTLLASGDIPDLIFGLRAIRDEDIAQFPGLFQDLSELIDTHAPNVQTMFNEHPETKVIATQLDGKIYGLPKYQRFWPYTVTRQFINQQWLDNLGLSVPTNWDELYDVLVAFKEKDANGNGDPNDEIPMDWVPAIDTSAGFGFFHVTALLGGTGIQLSESADGFFVEDGVVKNYFLDERYKGLVEFLTKCYKAGLVNPEVFTQDYSKYQSVARGNGDTAAVGYTFGWEITDRVGNELAPQYSFLGSLKQNAASTVTPKWGYDYNVLNYDMNMVTMSAACKDKEAAMRFINEFYDPEVSLQVLFGSIGTNIEKSADGSYKILPPQDPAMDPGTWKWTSTWADHGAMYISDSLNVTLSVDMQSIAEQTAPMQAALDAVQAKDILPRTFIKLTLEDNNTLALVRPNVLMLAMTKWANWITGTEDVQTGWDQYLKDMEATGIADLTAIWQKYYDEYNK